MQTFKDFLKESLNFRRTRSGAQFSEYYTVDDPGFDIDLLLQDVAERTAAGEVPQDEADPIGAYAGDEWVDEEDDVEGTTPSPLSSLTPSPDNSRAPSPSPARSSKRVRAKKTGSPSARPSKRRRPRFPSPPAPEPRASTIPVVADGALKKGKKLRSRRSRAKKREAGFKPTMPKLHSAGAKRLARAQGIDTTVDVDDLPVTRTAFTAKRGDRDAETYSLDDLVGPNARVPGMKLVDWDGSTPTGICVPDGRVFAVLAGHPNTPDWQATHEGLADELATWGDRVTFPKDSREHRRGNFRAEAHGWSHGGGQTAPQILSHSDAMTKVLNYIVGLTSMIRIAHFASDVFAAWAPELWLYYASRLSSLLSNSTHVAPNFARSVWACVTINFGPQTVTFKHRDFGNLSFGWCAITALGRFDWTKGGHLVLWECGLVIPFPPGSTVLIPSAIIHHSNASIIEGETRYSVTQYTSGAIFRWVDHGFRLNEDFFASLDEEGLREVFEMDAERWEFGTHLWSKLTDLKARANTKLGRTA